MVGNRLIAIGGSAGAIEGLVQLVGRLPAVFPASVLVVVHSSPDYPSYLHEILARRSELPAVAASDGQRLEAGRIVTARPNYHLLVMPGSVRLWRGPREHHTRPAIDPLFRTAASVYGARVIGVLLSGGLSDGTLGLLDILGRGGVTLAQDPQTTAFPDMPRNAIKAGGVQEVLPLDALADRLVELVQRPVAGEERAMDESRPAERVHDDVEAQVGGLREGQPALYTCPECGGTLWQFGSGDLLHFRCHVGHLYGARELAGRQADNSETALWYAYRTLIDQSRLLAQLSADARRQGHDAAADRFTQQAEQVREHAARLQELIEGAPSAAAD